MLDLKFIRDHTELVKTAAKEKKFEADVDAVIRWDDERKVVIRKVEDLKARRNKASEEVAKLKKAGQNADAVIAETKSVGEEIKALDEQLKVIEKNLRDVLLTIPNVPHPSAPQGSSPEDNQTIFTWGTLPTADFELKPHWELAEKHNLIDFATGVKIAGAGFPVYRGAGAKLQRALINFFLDSAADNGYTEVQPPIVVNTDSATGTGQLPDKEDQMYVVTRDEFFLIPTAEVPVTNIHREMTLKAEQLPIKYAAYTPCFRREAGSYGKDVRGLNRLHQFDKIELVKFVHPDTSYDELESLRMDAERLLQALQLPYRTLLMCRGDMGFTQTKKYDLEVWAAGQKRWLEVSSCSNFESFQARRMNIRYKDNQTGKPEFVHTLNGSGLALPRIVAAIMENYQTDEGTIMVPQVLRKYMGMDIISATT
ncbi:serine--tRNA ligase [bacterium]|nr:serine--tRNA ligase [bacterium]NUN45348.1 serine--tRNA ligase [bacterium]